MLLAAPAASATAAAQLRFLHAVPGAGSVAVRASTGGPSTTLGTGVGFGDATEYRDLSPGPLEIRLGSGGALRPEGEEALEDDSHYTAIAIAGRRGPDLRVYRDGAARGGRARLRVIHASPELGRADLRLDLRSFAEGLDFTEATPYRSVDPGVYDLSATPPAAENDDLVAAELELSAGAASTAVAVGSRGEPLRFVLLEDDSVVPRGAPATGLGGLSEGPPWRWALVLAAALAAGLAGGATYRAKTAGPGARRRARGH